MPQASRALLLVLVLLVTACSGKAIRPCTEGGEAARDLPIRGTKQCQQVKTTTGQFVNHGEYREWYANGKLAIEGEYRAGRRHGRWYEYDDQGKKLSDKWYEDGVEVPKAGSDTNDSKNSGKKPQNPPAR